MNQMILEAPVAKGDKDKNSYGKYGINNGVSFYLLGKAMGKEILLEAQLMIDFANLVKDLNDGLTQAFDKLKKIMKARLLATQLTTITNGLLIALSVGSTATLFVDPVENPTNTLQKIKSGLSAIGSKANMIGVFSASIPAGIFTFLSGFYSAKSTREKEVTEVLKVNTDNVFTSYDGGTKTLNALMQAIQESIKNEYKSSTLPLYYKNLQK